MLLSLLPLFSPLLHPELPVLSLLDLEREVCVHMCVLASPCLSWAPGIFSGTAMAEAGTQAVR